MNKSFVLAMGLVVFFFGSAYAGKENKGRQGTGVELCKDPNTIYCVGPHTTYKLTTTTGDYQTGESCGAIAPFYAVRCGQKKIIKMTENE
jgi:hypothetical protein